MRIIENETLKQIETNLLRCFIEICNKQDYRYSICGGTLIGAVRHGGFIPWDDDIDILMPRTDFERFLIYCKQNDPVFGVMHYSTKAGYCDGILKIYDPNTIIDDGVTYFYRLGLGIYIDVFPVDGMGNTKKDAIKLYHSSWFSRNVLIPIKWSRFIPSKTNCIFFEPGRFLFYLISRLTDGNKLIKKMDEKYQKTSFDSCEYAGSVYGSYKDKEVFPKAYLEEYINLPFEGMEVRAMARYHDYLTHYYGDYMILPPKEEQVSHHGFTAYYK